MCRCELSIDANENDPDSVVGDECHIVSGQNAGPRYDANFPSSTLDEFENLLLLCKVHHKQVDDQTETYTVDMLRMLKENHEKWVSEKLDKNEIRPLRRRRIKENIPPVLIRITSGQQLLRVSEGTCALSPENDPPKTEAEMELLSGFFQEMQDWDDILGDEAGDRVRAEFRFSELLEELEASGFWLFAAREVQVIEGGIEPGRHPFPVLILKVLRSSNPKIKTFDLSKQK